MAYSDGIDILLRTFPSAKDFFLNNGFKNLQKLNKSNDIN